MSFIYFDINRFDTSGSGAQVSGRLTMSGTSYSALSGGHGKGYLPCGQYTVKTRNVVVGDSTSVKAYTVGTTAFFIPIEPDFTTTRDGFGIHPDGNTVGTLGCIGLIGADSKAFWGAWMAMELSSRPTKLLVRTVIHTDGPSRGQQRNPPRTMVV